MALALESGRAGVVRIELPLRRFAHLPLSIQRLELCVRVRAEVSRARPRKVQLSRPGCSLCTVSCATSSLAIGMLAARARRHSCRWLSGSVGASRCGASVATGSVRQRIVRRFCLEWQAGKQDEQEFGSEQEYLAHLESQAQLPQGFSIGNGALKFVPEEAQEMGELPMKLTVISLDKPTSAYAAVFTSNAFPGAPVRVGKQRLAQACELQAMVVNNKISNVSPPDEDGGLAASEAVCSEVAKQLNLPGGARSVMPSSTGVIGWRLPVKEMIAAVPDALAFMQGDSALPAAKGIMTTDRYPKLSAKELPGGARLVGIAKGAGMIEPNMATMLSFLMTDAALPRSDLQQMLEEAVAGSFNSISVDGDESTSDTVLLISSERCAPPAPGLREAFRTALLEVCADLAALVVHNGEGTRHVIRVAVTGASDDATARRVAKAVVNGPLFKSAVAGNDPNVGRLVGKVGQALGPEGAAMAAACVCRIGGETIFEEGRFALDTEKERRLSAHMKMAEADSKLSYPPHRRVVDVEVCLGSGPGEAVVLGSDLTAEYVEINADYRS
eukprot:TRINITY_DN36013_c0_g1_i1.p1 TRINITY_DN36013_c0_g1~~TRINITY_DN36013_c0_g1_i1.p1  ORF type:complete len:571 (+),score=111.60 TRINITY_DN36013_c0_g1_i1:45-1715(+)